MKLFQVSQEYMIFIGVRPLLSGEKNPFNCRNVGFLMMFGQMFTAMTTFLVYDAQTLREYTECVFAWISATSVFVGMLLVLVKTGEFYQIIENLEIIVENCKFFKSIPSGKK